VTSLAIWGPTLVMAIAVLSVGAVLIRGSRKSRRVDNKSFVAFERTSAVLSAALRQAESVNAFQANLSFDPAVHLNTVIRISPVTYQDGVSEIPRHFSRGHVVSVDIGSMNAHQAARLVDFCSGYLVGAPGWLFRAADKVIVLTPIGRK
jgi:FtsZ-interacting cell division protein YlmF